MVLDVNDASSSEDIINDFNGTKGRAFFVYTGKKQLHDYIADLDLADRFNLRMKICSNIRFDCDVYINNEKVDDIKSLLIKATRTDDDEVILDTDDNAHVSNLLQQLIYLGLKIPVYRKDEKENRIRFERLSKHTKQLKEKVIELSGYLEQGNFNGNLALIANNVKLSMENIGKSLDETSRRELTIAAMGTKKCGKSMVINCFLGEEYAPTSLELPTPNTILYEVGDKIELSYQGKKQTFNSASEINRHLDSLFKTANRAKDEDAGKRLEDMTISYIPVNESFSDIKLKIADTPGPNLAGAGHEKTAQNWIEKSDVILYVIDYEKHATKDEIDFLEDIKSNFEKLDKFYSLIVVINKADKVFETQENKSLTRVASFIKEKIINLGFKTSIVIPTTSKAYFYTNYVSDKGISTDRDELKTAIWACEDNGDRKEAEVISYVSEMLERLDNIRMDKSFQNIIDFSNFGFILDYSTYIAQGKALDEIAKNAFHKIESELNLIKNQYASLDLVKNMKNQKEKIQEIINKLDSSINAILSSIVVSEIFGGLKQDILADIIPSIEKDINDSIKDFEVDLKEEPFYKAKLTEEQLKSMYYDGNTKILEDRSSELLHKLVTKRSLSRYLDMVDEQLVGHVKGCLRDSEIKINGAQKRINEAVNEANTSFKKEYGNFNDFKTNQLDFAFNKLIMNGNIKFSNKSLYLSNSKSFIVEKGFYTRTWNLFRGDSDFKFNKEKVLELLVTQAKEAVSPVVLEAKLTIHECVDDMIDSLRKNIESQLKSYTENIRGMTNVVKNDLDADAKIIDEKMKFIEAFIQQAAYQYLDNSWSEIKTVNLED